MSVANENDKYDQNDYVRVFEEYLKTESPIDLVVMNKLGKRNRILAKVLNYYEMEHSFPILINRKVNEFATVEEELSVIEKKNYRIRHSEVKLAKFFNHLEERL